MQVFDAEWIHQTARLVYEIRTLIPAKHGRPTKKEPTGCFRRRMARNFDNKTYGQRAQIETVFSMFKRRLGSSVNAHHYWSQCRALLLKAITHNLLILYLSGCSTEPLQVLFDESTCARCPQ